MRTTQLLYHPFHQSTGSLQPSISGPPLLKKFLEKLNIEPITAHGLRHTHASILLYKRASIYYVSERLGHGDIETTMAYYAHIIKELREQDENISIKTFEELVV